MKKILLLLILTLSLFSISSFSVYAEEVYETVDITNDYYIVLAGQILGSSNGAFEFNGSSTEEYAGEFSYDVFGFVLDDDGYYYFQAYSSLQDQYGWIDQIAYPISNSSTNYKTFNFKATAEAIISINFLLTMYDDIYYDFEYYRSGSWHTFFVNEIVDEALNPSLSVYWNLNTDNYLSELEFVLQNDLDNSIELYESYDTYELVYPITASDIGMRIKAVRLVEEEPIDEEPEPVLKWWEKIFNFTDYNPIDYLLSGLATVTVGVVVAAVIVSFKKRR